MDRLLLTPAEAAQALGISRSKLYDLMRAGVVPSLRIGGCRRVAAVDLEEVVTRLREEATV